LDSLSTAFPSGLLETLRSCVTIPSAIDAYATYLRRFGIANLLISGLPVADQHSWKRSIIIDQWPRDWYDRYLAEGHYRFDPCVLQCRQTIQSFMWSDIDEAALGARQRLVLEEAGDFKMRNGLCVPLHRPRQPPAVITLSGEAVEMNETERLIVEILSNQLFQTVSRLTRPAPSDEENGLSLRELEVLQVMADGKSAADAACILNVSKHTIERHLLNIRLKTNAINTTHAVAKSLRAHQIF
jgi:LuxR family quorum sensing-dependent transcriptional regulator